MVVLHYKSPCACMVRLPASDRAARRPLSRSKNNLKSRRHTTAVSQKLLIDSQTASPERPPINVRSFVIKIVACSNKPSVTGLSSSKYTYYS